MEEYNTEWLLEVVEKLKDTKLVYNEADLCQKAGIPKSYLSDMKSGRRSVSKQTVRKIRQAFPSIFEEKDENEGNLERLLRLLESSDKTIAEHNRRLHDEVERILDGLGFREVRKEKTA